MRSIAKGVFGAMLLFTATGLALAQETTPPPKVLVIDREFIKPGKGAGHEKTESAVVEAFTRAKWPTRYFAATSLSGKSRALFFTAYDSFEAWEKDNAAADKNTAFSNAVDRAFAGDGDLLSKADRAVLVYNEDQSLRAPVDIAHMRYFEISVYRVRSGHRDEWNELVKLVKSAYDKIPDAHWAMYESMYGLEGTNFLVFVPMKSLAEVDHSMTEDKQFADAIGEDGMKKFHDLESSAVEFYQSNLFHFNPKMSYPPEPWVKADPGFWGHKPAMKTPAKNKSKPAANQ